jgi:hypothetical protein
MKTLLSAFPTTGMPAPSTLPTDVPDLHRMLPVQSPSPKDSKASSDLTASVQTSSKESPFMHVIAYGDVSKAVPSMSETTSSNLRPRRSTQPPNHRNNSRNNTHNTVNSRDSTHQGTGTLKPVLETSTSPVYVVLNEAALWAQFHHEQNEVWETPKSRHVITDSTYCDTEYSNFYYYQYR